MGQAKAGFAPLLLVLLLSVLPGAGMDLYTPALVQISINLHATAALSKLTLSVYLLGYGLGVLCYGITSDYCRRVTVLKFGLATYIVATILAAMSPTIHLLLLARLCQGLSVAIPGLTFKTMFTDFFEPNEVTKVVALSSSAWGCGVIVSPFIGGYLTHYLGWRSCFIFLAVYGLVCLLVQLLLMPKHFNHVIPFSKHTLQNTLRRVVSHQKFWMLALCVGFSYSIIVIFNILAPFLIQNTLGYSAKGYGYIALGMGAAFFIGSLILRRLIQTYSEAALIKYACIGAVVLGLIMILLAHMLPPKQQIFLMLVQAALYFCISALMILPMAVCMKIFPDIAGTSNALLNTVYILLAMAISSTMSFVKAHTALPLCYANLLLVMAFIVCAVIAFKQDTQTNCQPT